MKSEKYSSRSRASANRKAGNQPATVASRLRIGFTPLDWFALAFGLFLGLAIVKFGNPVILESKIAPPASALEFWWYAWPPRWSLWLLLPLSLAGVWLAITRRPRWPGARWLWVLPIIWLGWQLVASLKTIDGKLTTTTLWQLGGVGACYFLGALVLGSDRGLRLMLIGMLAGFTFCLVQAVKQRLFEFPQERQLLIESERAGWTNLPPNVILEWKQNGAIITTNGVDIANPAFIVKYTKGRVHGTMVYANALAGVVLLLFPVATVLAFTGTRRFKRPTRLLAIAVTLFLGGAGLFWTGSKSGWLIAVALGGLWLFRLDWPTRAKWTLFALLLIAGLVVFGIRFRSYFASGATSVGARFDYWRAAGQIARQRPLFGSGPGTFQHPYAELKRPEAEMARLVHNDYLEQFSDSGFIGGLSYLSWIGLLTWTLAKRTWRLENPMFFALFIGILGWFVQGLSEFGLYVPALAWTAFALGGCLLKLTDRSVGHPA
jgi:O-Antigen ligase